MTFPYAGLPDYQVWRKAVSSQPHIDPQGSSKFQFDHSSKIGSGGSCFAQRIAQRLRESGYHYFVTEPGPSWQSVQWLQKNNFGTYSARFGDVYTSKQLLQLAQRALGDFTPSEPPWKRNGRYHDPFRPRVNDGFDSEEALLEDRERHLAAVKRLFSETDFFVFTLGLTETWCCADDEAVLPMCPGTSGYGTFDDKKYFFRNLSVEDNVSALTEFLSLVSGLNENLKIILTVSPVPLAATIESRHVVQSTVVSKSILRIAASEIVKKYQNVDYFASYEIVNGTFDGCAGFENDGRTVREEAVDRVMASFYKHFTVHDEAASPQLLETIGRPMPTTEIDPCDEAFLLKYITQENAADR